MDHSSGTLIYPRFTISEKGPMLKPHPKKEETCKGPNSGPILWLGVPQLDSLEDLPGMIRDETHLTVPKLLGPREENTRLRKPTMEPERLSLRDYRPVSGSVFVLRSAVVSFIRQGVMAFYKGTVIRRGLRRA